MMAGVRPQRAAWRMPCRHAAYASPLGSRRGAGAPFLKGLLKECRDRREAVDAELHAALRAASIAIAAVPTSELAAEARAPSITVFEGRWAGAPGS